MVRQHLSTEKIASLLSLIATTSILQPCILALVLVYWVNQLILYLLVQGGIAARIRFVLSSITKASTPTLDLQHIY